MSPRLTPFSGRSENPPAVSFGPRQLGLLAVICLVTLTVRIWDVSTHFLFLGDQIRDWEIALGPFRRLPLIGPPTHVGGYTIGPAFYWILWLIRIMLGPWFHNLPHAGGIGQALLQSGADALLLFAVWHRTRSVPIALTTIVLLATASFDLSLSAVIWNPIVGSTLAKTATALVLLDWPRSSRVHVVVTAAVAWSAVHAYTGTIFVALSILAAIFLEPWSRGDRVAAWRNACLIAGVVAVLQLPYAIHQLSTRFADSAMGAVTGSIGQIFLGAAWPQIGKSVAGYAGAFTFIEAGPWGGDRLFWLLVACAVIVAVRHRRDPVLLATILLPQALAILGYALWLSGLDAYYYLSLMPAAVLTILLGITDVMPPRVARAAGVAMLVGSLAIVPARLRFAATMNRLPQYGLLVEASRDIVKRLQPMRAIETELALPPTADPGIIYEILGGRIDPDSPWIAVITSSGRVEYRNVGASR
jgi:hypothetical protein